MYFYHFKYERGGDNRIIALNYFSDLRYKILLSVFLLPTIILQHVEFDACVFSSTLNDLLVEIYTYVFISTQKDVLLQHVEFNTYVFSSTHKNVLLQPEKFDTYVFSITRKDVDRNKRQNWL